MLKRCGPEETRTPHLSNANATLYQMSYGPEKTKRVFIQPRSNLF